MVKRARQRKTVFSNYDSRVLLALGIVCLFGLFYLLLQKKKYVDCEQADFKISAQKYIVGEIISFSNESTNAEKWKWEFGDGSEIKTKQYEFHTYSKPGRYEVSLIINGVCNIKKEIEISYYDIGLVDPNLIPKINVKSYATVGRPVDFSFSYPEKVYTAEWSFGETNQLDNTKVSPYYIYTSPGLKQVSLIVNGDVKALAKAEVFVKPKVEVKQKLAPITRYNPLKPAKTFEHPIGEPEKDPVVEYVENIPAKPMSPPAITIQDSINIELKRAPELSHEQFELLLLDVASQAKTKDDFSDYLCENFDVPVLVNGEDLFSFTDFCQKIKGKEIRFEAIGLQKDNLNCIDNINLSYEVKKLIGWGKDKN